MIITISIKATLAFTFLSLAIFAALFLLDASFLSFLRGILSHRM